MQPRYNMAKVIQITHSDQLKHLLPYLIIPPSFCRIGRVLTHRYKFVHVDMDCKPVGGITEEYQGRIVIWDHHITKEPRTLQEKLFVLGRLVIFPGRSFLGLTWDVLGSIYSSSSTSNSFSWLLLLTE